MDVRVVASALAAMLAASACGAGASPTPPGSLVIATPTPVATPAASTGAPAATPSATPAATPAPTPVPTPVLTTPPTLTPTAATRPSNDNPPGTVIATLPFNGTTNTTRAQIYAMEPSSTCGASGGQSVWYAFTATADQTLVADTAGSDYDTIVDVWAGTLTASNLANSGVDTLTPVACNDNTAGTRQSGVVFAATAGHAYVIRVISALNSPGGTLTFHLAAG